MNPNCPKCHGDGWCCEAHPDRPWLDGKGCCGEPGVPCECNPEGRNPPGLIVLKSAYCEPEDEVH